MKCLTLYSALPAAVLGSSPGNDYTKSWNIIAVILNIIKWSHHKEYFSFYTDFARAQKISVVLKMLLHWHL